MNVDIISALSEVSTWRPLGECDLSAGQTLLQNAIAAWHEKWFVAKYNTISPTNLLSCGEEIVLTLGSRAWSCGAHMWLLASSASMASLTRNVLEIPEHGFSSHEQGSSIMEKVGRQIEDELLLALHYSMNDDASRPTKIPNNQRECRILLPQGGAQFSVLTPSGKTILTIICDAHVLRKKNQFRTLRLSVSAALQPRAEAMALARVKLSAMLGEVELSVPQLTHLAVGDVIALARPLDGTVPLLLSGTRTQIAEGRLGRSDHMLSIQLTSLA